MSTKYAEFYKCSLQVNPYSYISYRGDKHEITEAEYNDLILENCSTEGIRIVGMANHGDVQNSESLRNHLTDYGIIVFPGFEIATTEKIHIVCLFDEKTTTQQLERYLGSLGLTDTKDGILPSTLGCIEIAKKIEELKGFWYAAHVTSDNGVLKLAQNNIWKSTYLKAAQIPAKKDQVETKYINILKNRDPAYKKETSLALINAKDISRPEDLLLETSSCLVKMSEPNFECFKLAFQDPDARVKLKSELSEIYQSTLNSLTVKGGYLDGLYMDIAPNLNTIIGGRGTGKSTLIELIRYGLELAPKSTEAKKTLENLIKGNLGTGGRVEIDVTSHRQLGKKFKVIKRYSEPAKVEHEDGRVSKLLVKDILPNIEIYGQNEIIDLISDETAKLQILNRFLNDTGELEIEKGTLMSSLDKNASLLIEKYEERSKYSNKLDSLPSLKEKKKNFSEFGISDKLKIIEELSTEEEHISTTLSNIKSHEWNPKRINFPFDDSYVDTSKNKHLFQSIKNAIDTLNTKIVELMNQYEEEKSFVIKRVEDEHEIWKKYKSGLENEIKKAVKSIGELNGKSGEEIATDYRETIKQIANIEPLEKEVTELNQEISTLEQVRRTTLEKLNKCLDHELDGLRKIVKKINKNKLNGKVKIEIYPKENRDKLINFLAKEHRLGSAGLQWINDVEQFNISTFVQSVREGKDSLINTYKHFGLKPAGAEIIALLGEEKIMKIETIELSNVIDVLLNVSTNGENYRSLDRLSKGQQCTAILNILLLENKDPLLIDQPEDNLDNSYIANNLVEGLRELKINRQFLFATHNANIPVFGDAELIAVMEESDGAGGLKEDALGSVDNPIVKAAVINTLEGGNAAFRMRKEKYNLK